MSSTKVLKKVHMQPEVLSDLSAKTKSVEQTNVDDKTGDVQKEHNVADDTKPEEATNEAQKEEEVEESETEILKEPDDSVHSEQTEETSQMIVSEEPEEPNPEEIAATNSDLLKSFPSDYFLNKHTPSFRCLEQYLTSRSDLRVTLYFFPPLTDPGLDDALHYIPPPEEPDSNGCDKYLTMCKDLNIVPIKRIINSLSTATLDLKYYGLTLKQMRGISSALKVNSNINHLILQDNWMSPDATSLISEILRENNSIRILNLRECRIGEEGAEKLCEGLASTQFLQELDLSFNSLGNEGLKILQPSLIENVSLKKLNISHNDLTEDSAETLEHILLENKTLEQLDLSWNGFCTGPGNKRLFNGLTKNELISWLNLSWNGIGTSLAMRPITKYLRKTTTLQFLDLSWNRITQTALKLLRSALIKNTSLTKVMLGNNIYTPEEAHFLASLFTKAKNNLVYLDMENMCVNKTFLPLVRQLGRQGKTITYGHVLSNYHIGGPDIDKLVFERCRFLAMKPKKKKQKKDFGHFILSLPDTPIVPQDFQTLLKKKKVKKIDKDLLNELMTRFMTKKNKVECVAMKDAYMKLYPDTVLPEEKKKKKQKKGRKHKKGKQADEEATTDEAPTDDEALKAGDEAPTAGDEAPTGGDEAPTGGDEAPTGGDEAPTAGDEAPTTGDEAPTTGDEAPTTGDEAPTAGDEAPTAGDEAPTAGDEAPTANKPEQ